MRNKTKNAKRNNKFSQNYLSESLTSLSVYRIPAFSLAILYSAFKNFNNWITRNESTKYITFLGVCVSYFRTVCTLFNSSKAKIKMTVTKCFKWKSRECCVWHVPELAANCAVHYSGHAFFLFFSLLAFMTSPSNWNFYLNTTRQSENGKTNNNNNTTKNTENILRYI